MHPRRPLRPLVVGVFGLLVALSASLVYARDGYHRAIPLSLLAAVGAITWSLGVCFPTRPRHAKWRPDLIAIAILLAVAAPLYLWRLYTIPWQVNSDEVSIVQAARQLLSAPSTDPMGLSWYFGFPSAGFVVVGTLAKLIGGLDFFHVRVIHALFGVGIVLLAYGLFRQFTTPLRAGTLALLVGANHSLVAISRMAMRDNTGLFLELLALLWLVRGYQRRSPAGTFLGGAAAGLTFYTYFPSRITLVVWATTLAAIWLWRPSRRAFRRVVTAGALALVGWAVVAAPVLIASKQHQEQAFGYQRQQFLFYSEGQRLEQEWTSAPTPAAAWKQNIRQGLATFNGGLHDQGYIYPNYGHGFVDPITGTLLWVGVLVSVQRLLRPRRVRVAELLALTGFLALYFALALLITKAPNYTRLLVILPFVGYLAGVGLWWLATRIAALLLRGAAPASRRMVASVIAVGAVVVIVAFNLHIFHDFVRRGAAEGNDVGGTGRLVESRKREPGHGWVLAADKASPYYSWGEAYQWQTWLGFWAGEGQSVRVVPPDSLGAAEFVAPFTLFLSLRAWNEQRQSFETRYRVDSVAKVVPSGRLVAVEVSGLRQQRTD